jgi:hypothetical protein
MKVLASASLALVLASAPVAAAPTMAVWGDDGTGLSPNLTIQADKPFDVVVTLDSDGYDAAAAEWVMTELRIVYPGLFAIATKKINDTPLDLGLNDGGEYLMAFGDCEPSGDRIELARITYADLTGVVGTRSTLVTLRGFEPGDTQPSSFSGQPGFVDCDNSKHAAEMGGNENQGALCVNCYQPPERETSMTELKAKF